GFDVDPDFCRSNGRKILPDRVDAFFAANPATARDGPEPRHRARLQFHSRAGLDDNNVVAIPRVRGPREFFDLVLRPHDPFRKKKAGGKFFIVPRRAHGCGEGLAADANLERFLDSEIVAQKFKGSVPFSPDDFSRPDAIGVFLHFKDSSELFAIREYQCYHYAGGNLPSLHFAEPQFLRSSWPRTG